MTYIEWLLAVISASLGGLNIFQLVFWRSEKKKMQAEATSADAEAQQKIRELHHDAYDDLVNRLTKYQSDYFALAEHMQEQTRKNLETINGKCNEIAELKSKIVYFKGLRCYKTDCSFRIRTNPKDSKEKAIENGES